MAIANNRFKSSLSQIIGENLLNSTKYSTSKAVYTKRITVVNTDID